MQLVIMSDTHGNTEVIEQIKEQYPNATFIHCGDSELQHNTAVLDDVHIVRGNCDMDCELPEEKLVEVGNTKILVVHGHYHNVHRTPLNLVYRAKEIGAQIVCFGHTHIAGAEWIDDVLVINPGSMTQSRSEHAESYALATYEGQWHVTFIDVDKG